MFSGIMKREIILVFFFYLTMAIGYYMALVIDTGHYRNQLWPVTINHLLKGLITLLFWWLFFRGIAAFAIWKKVLIHLVALPLFTIIWVFFYYQICDYLGFYRLQQSRMVWDYYMTALFYIIQFGNFHLYTYYKGFQQQQLLAAQLGELTLQSELSALKAQLNPHFLYNVFNTINAAIPSQAKPARDMVNKLSDLFRYQLKASQEDLVLLKEELDFVKKYLELEQERFGDRLSFKIAVEEEALTDKIPPMIFQPIIENAVKHGLSSLVEGGQIILQIRKNTAHLAITISDTGVGIDENEKDDLLKRGVGLSNTHERLKKMYGKGLELHPNHPAGLVVQFSLPLNEEKPSL